MNIILIALHNKEYGKMAFNLAASIKKNIKAHITLLYDDNAVKGLDLRYFDSMVEPDIEDYTDNQIINPFKLKTRLYKYAKGDTLYLDVDMFANKSIGLFAFELEKHDLFLPKVPYLHWAKTDKPNQPVNTSIIWFKKTAENKKLFKQIEKEYLNEIPHDKIGSYYPDEIPFSLALANVELPNIKSLYLPDKRYVFKEMISHPFLCMAGQPVIGAISDYDRMVRAQALELGYPVYKFNRRAKVYQ